MVCSLHTLQEQAVLLSHTNTTASYYSDLLGPAMAVIITFVIIIMTLTTVRR